MALVITTMNRAHLIASASLCCILACGGTTASSTNGQITAGGTGGTAVGGDGGAQQAGGASGNSGNAGGSPSGGGSGNAGAAGALGTMCDVLCGQLTKLSCYPSSAEKCAYTCAAIESCAALPPLIACIQKIPIACDPSVPGPIYGECTEYLLNEGACQFVLPPEPCEVNKEVACKCGDALGVATCGADGMWGACACGGGLSCRLRRVDSCWAARAAIVARLSRRTCRSRSASSTKAVCRSATRMSPTP